MDCCQRISPPAGGCGARSMTALPYQHKCGHCALSVAVCEVTDGLKSPTVSVRVNRAENCNQQQHRACDASWFQIQKKKNGGPSNVAGVNPFPLIQTNQTNLRRYLFRGCCCEDLNCVVQLSRFVPARGTRYDMFTSCSVPLPLPVPDCTNARGVGGDWSRYSEVAKRTSRSMSAGCAAEMNASARFSQGLGASAGSLDLELQYDLRGGGGGVPGTPDIPCDPCVGLRPKGRGGCSTSAGFSFCLHSIDHKSLP